MEFKDYYSVLGVESGAGEAEIKTAYRRLARKYHPDVSKESDAEDRFKSVSEAYEVLSDRQKRAEYDQLRARGYRPGEEFRPPPGFGQQGPGTGGFEFGEGLGSGSGGGFSDFFESMFGRGRPGAGPPPGPQASGDTRAQLRIPLEIAFAGGSQRLSVDGRTLDVKIPAGVKPGQVIRLGGQGAQGRTGRGALLLEIQYAPHPQFEIDGANVLHTLPVFPWEAALGATVSVSTLGGPVELKIPPGSDAGSKLRLRGRGMPATPTAGDQIVELEIRAPRPTTDAQKTLYRKMADAFAGEARRA